jgi:hypothetical protein
VDSLRHAGRLGLERREFLLGAAASVLNYGLPVHPASAKSFGFDALPRNGQVNLNNAAVEIDFPYLNLAKGSLGFTPVGGTPTQDPWALLDSDGYPTAIPTGSHAWRADTNVYYLGKESYFSGQVSGRTLTVTGSVIGVPLFIGQTITQSAGGPALAVQSRIISFSTGSGGPGTYMLSQSSSSTGSISMQGFVPWVCDWQGKADVSASYQGEALVFPPRSVVIGRNRIELNVSALNQGAGATFNLSISAGSRVATLTNVVGTPFSNMRISGPGIPPHTKLIGTPGNWSVLLITNGSPGGGVLSYDLKDVPTTGAALAFGENVRFTIQITSIRSRLSNIRVYRQDQEASLNSGQVSAPHFLDFYRQYGRLRFMNYQTINGSMLANWEDRTPESHFCWSGLSNILPAKYAGRCPATANNHFVGLHSLPGNPTLWTDKMTAQFTVSNCPATVNFIGTIDNTSGGSGNTLTVTTLVSGALRIGLQIRKSSNYNEPTTCTVTAGSGTTWTIDGPPQLVRSRPMLAYAPITGFSNTNPARVTCPNHGFKTGDVLVFPDPIVGGHINSRLNQIGGNTGTNWSTSYAIAVINSNQFDLDGVDSTSWGAYSSGGLAVLAPTFKTGALPPKLITGIGIGNYGIGGGYDNWQNLDANTPTILTAVYDIDLDVLIVGGRQQFRAGLPIEAAVRMANELNGPDPWICVPAYGTDEFVLKMATYIKANLNSQLKWCFELSNEVWNQGAGFWQTQFAYAVARTKWPTIKDGSHTSQWYGWRFHHMITQINSVYSGNSQVWRIFGYRTDGAFDGTQRATAPATGVSSPPLKRADSLCLADYISLQSANQTLPAAVDIYNYQQGMLTGNASLIASAFAGMDKAFTAYGCGPVFSPITASIDNGAGRPGNILTVTNISTTGAPKPTNPRIGPYSVLSPYGRSKPAVGSYVLSQLSSTESGGAPNKRGTYLLAGPTQLISSSTFTCTGSTIDQLLNTYIPYFLGLAASYKIEEVCFYEGGFGDIPGFQSQYTDHGGHPINLQDLMNLEVAYQTSSNYAAVYLAYLNAQKSLGTKYSSQYCMTDLIPSPGGMYGMVYNIFGAQPPAKTHAFDIYNAE